MLARFSNMRRLAVLGLTVAAILTAATGPARASCPDCGDPGQFLGQVCPNPKCPSNTGWKPAPKPVKPDSSSGDRLRVGLIHDATQLFPLLNKDWERLEAEHKRLHAEKNRLLKLWNSGQMPEADRDRVRREYKQIEADLERLKEEAKKVKDLRSRKVTIEYVNMDPGFRVRDVVLDSLKRFRGVTGDKLTIYRDKAGKVHVVRADGTDITDKFPGIN